MSDYTSTFDGAAKDAANSIASAAEISVELDAIEVVTATKADKSIPSVSGNLAALSVTGNLQDSGKAYPSGTVVGTTDTQTLTNKTLTAPVLSGTVTGTYTIGGTPTFPSTIVSTTGAQTLTNKTLTTPVISSISNTGTLTLPTSSDTLVGRATTDTLTNKTLTAPVLSGTVTGTYTIGGTPTFPSTVVLTTGSQTLSSKTLTAPVISTISNTGTLTLPTSSDTLVGRATTDTLTNKTISGASNTLSNIANTSLKTANASGSGTVNSVNSVIITLNTMTFFPACSVETSSSSAGSGEDVYFSPYYTDQTSASAPKFHLRNQSGTNRDYNYYTTYLTT